jgi:hypothetical protein
MARVISDGVKRAWITICCKCKARYYYAGKWHDYSEEVAMRLNREPITLDNCECDKCDRNTTKETK